MTLDAQSNPGVVLVCTGWRKMHKLDYGKAAASEWFDYVERNHGRIVAVVEGGQTGADTLCKAEAKRRGIPCRTIRADWSIGKKAGPIRNQKMVDFVNLTVSKTNVPLKVVGLAFLAPESTGTVDMVKRMEAEKWWVEKVHLPRTEQVA